MFTFLRAGVCAAAVMIVYHAIGITAATGQDLSASASINASGGGSRAVVTSARPVITPVTNGFSLTCTGQGVSSYEDPTINMTISLSGPTGQIAGDSGGGTGFLQMSVSGNSVSEPDDEPYFCNVFVWNTDVSASAVDSAVVPGDNDVWYLEDFTNTFTQHVGNGNYLKAEVFQFKTLAHGDYKHADAISEDFYVEADTNECNLTIVTQNGNTDADGFFGDRYGNWQLQDPGAQNLSFTCPSNPCNSYFQQLWTFQTHQWGHSVHYTCTDVTWGVFGGRLH